MRAGRRVLVPHLGEPTLREARGELDQRRPETAVHVGDLPVHELADQHVGARADRLGREEDRPALRVPPPASPDPLAGHGLREARNGPAGRLQHDSVLLDEGEGLLRAHGCFFAYESAPMRWSET